MTVSHEIARSGWWPISSATGAMSLTRPTEPMKSPRSKSLVMASRSRVQPSAPPALPISSSLRRAIVPSMRIASLVPSSTEMLFELGLGDSIVAVTHECDYPPAAADLPHLTAQRDPRGPVGGRDRRRRARARGPGQGPVRARRGRRWPSRSPDLIVTQAVCDVCAVSFDDVRAVADRLPSRPEVISLDPTTIGEMLADVPRLAEAAGRARRGRAAGGGRRRAPGRRPGRGGLRRPDLGRWPWSGWTPSSSAATGCRR